MKHGAITEFLERFGDLKARVKHNPGSVVWMAKEREDVARCSSDLSAAWRKLNQYLATSPEKGISRVPSAFKTEFRDFQSDWLRPVEAAAQVHWDKIRPEVEQFISELPKERIAELSRPNFDPTKEDPAELVADMIWLSSAYEDFDDDLGDEQRKAQQAWRYFEDTIGLDLREVNKRWLLIQPIFIPEHVSNTYGANDPTSLNELLYQAVRAFVFGATSAAIAMCRALMDLVLRKHYRCEGEDLKAVIVFAEAQPRYFWMRELRLQEKRLLANALLHDYRRIEEEAVVQFLSALKELIERSPKTTFPR